MSDEFELTVPHGERLQVAVSALIKHLRRGRELEAMWWARQIEKRYPLYLWRKLCTFAAEEVGLADPHAIVLVNACAEASQRHRDQSSSKRSDEQQAALAVLYLARAPKSREANDLLATQGLRDETHPVPPEAYDLHTDEGKAAMPTKAERMRHWLHESSRVVPDVGPVDWRLAVRRYWAEQGVLDPDEVEEQARRWEAEGRLLYGLDGYEGEKR